MEQKHSGEHQQEIQSGSRPQEIQSSANPLDLPLDKTEYDLAKWLCYMIDSVNCLLAFILIVTGITSQQYIINGVLAAWALVGVGLIALGLSLVGALIIYRHKTSEMCVLANTKIVMIILLAVYALGLLSFISDMDLYVYDHWTQLRHKSQWNQVQFSYMVQSKVASLQMFSLTICCGMALQVFLLLSRLQPVSQRRHSARAFAMYYCLYASTGLFLSLYLQHGQSNLVLPSWVLPISICLTATLTLQAVVGYYLTEKEHQYGLDIYYYSLLIACLAMMLLAALYIVFFFVSYQIIDDEWPSIQSSLLEHGYRTSQLSFKLQVNSHLKLAGLYGLVFLSMMFLALCSTTRHVSLLKSLPS